MQDAESVKEAQGELSSAMGILRVLVFSMFRRWEAQTLAPRFVDICWALDPYRPEGTEGVRAFKTHLLRAKKRDLYTIQFAFSLKIHGHLPPLSWAFDQVTFGREACCKLDCLG